MTKPGQNSGRLLRLNRQALIVHRSRSNASTMVCRSPKVGWPDSEAAFIVLSILSAQVDFRSRRFALFLGAIAAAACTMVALWAPVVAFAEAGSISGRVIEEGIENNPLPEVLVCADQNKDEERIQGHNSELTGATRLTPVCSGNS
jgi:hypothetical protein